MMARFLRPFSFHLRTPTAPFTPILSRGYTVTTRPAVSPAVNDKPHQTPQSEQKNLLKHQQPNKTPNKSPNETSNKISAPPSDKHWNGSINITDERVRLKINQVERGFVHTVLRDACKCSQCIDKHSKQRNFRTSDIPIDIKPRSVRWDGEELEVQWQNDIEGFDSSHVSKYTTAELVNPTTYPPGCDVGRQRSRVHWNKAKMDESQHWISYEDYMNNPEKFTVAMRKLSLYGLIFVKDIPDSREMVEQIATRMGPIRNTFYGPTWDVRKVPEAKNVAYTSQFLDYHMDLMYMNEPPGFQLLHCLRNSCDGGESLFADTFRVAYGIFQKSPELYKQLTYTRLNYEYLHNDHKYSNSWPVFELSKARGSRFPPVHVNYSPPFQGPLRFSENQRRPRVEAQLKALRHFVNELEKPENSFELKLKPGECVIFENRRVVHARRQFNTDEGERWLAGTYVDEDAVLSTFRKVREQNKDAWKAMTPSPPQLAE